MCVSVSNHPFAASIDRQTVEGTGAGPRAVSSVSGTRILAAPIAVLDCDWGQGRRELEGVMLTKTALVVALCGIGASVPSLAQDETKIFQYSPIARLEAGQYRAEVWRREIASGKEEAAWSNSDLHGSAAEALAAACAKLRENFDASFACIQTSRDANADKTVTESRPPPENGSKTPPAMSPVPAPKAVAATSQPASNWAKEFWTNQSRWGHGGGDGGGGGGGGGCQ